MSEFEEMLKKNALLCAVRAKAEEAEAGKK